MKRILAVTIAALMLSACKSNTNDNMSTLTLTREWVIGMDECEKCSHERGPADERDIGLGKEIAVFQSPEGTVNENPAQYI